jgi:orotate phosphoribosyltransferase
MNTLADKKIAKVVAKELLKIHAVTINTVKPYRYVSGILAPIYTDNRLIMSHPNVWNMIIDNYIKVIHKKFSHTDVLSGTATAAIPHTSVLAYRLGIPMVYVRSAKKEHGKENLIEGEFPRKSRVLIIEDLISTGKSIGINVQAIRGAGGTVSHCLAITTSTISAFAENIHGLKIKLITLTNIETIIDTAVREKYITKKESEIVHTFLKDPKGWGSKMGFE